MKLKMFQVDAFAGRVFEGNPAAVVPLDAWLDDARLQAIAEENNLSETAFFVRAGEGYQLRWFTPAAEVDLCGHATLASAHVLYTHLNHSGPAIRFHTRSGDLTVSRRGQSLCMDFPSSPPTAVDTPAALAAGLGRPPVEVLAAFDYLAVYASESDVRALAPDFMRLKELDRRGVIATAPGKDVDFVSRCFFPGVGIDEDPVTGSAHCILAPYWSGRLGRKQLIARQVSKRGGTIHCELEESRVLLAGTATDYMVADINIP